jgi:very-short-patch-repair endonuclease
MARPKEYQITLGVCLSCGREFSYIPYKRRPHRKYCGHACARIAQSNKVSKMCPVCNKEFQIPASNATRYTVCSIQCRGINTLHRKCARCGKEFTAHSQDIRHCSEICRRPASIKVCDQCGKTFRHRPNEKPRFCSLSCYRRFISGNGGETSIEKTTRNILDKLQVAYKQEAKLGRYSIDFLLPQFNLAIECDGNYWHRNSKRDAAKNKYIKRNHYKLLRLSETIIKSGEAETVIKQFIDNLNMYLIPQG